MNKPTRTFSYSDQGYDSEQKSWQSFVSVSSMVPAVHSDQVAPYMVVPLLPKDSPVRHGHRTNTLPIDLINTQINKYNNDTDCIFHHHFITVQNVL